MIDTQLPPLARDTVNQSGELLEAFAYTYLASYTPNLVTEDSLVSFKRAWGYDFLKLMQTTTTPSVYFYAGYYHIGNSVHVVVGIPGVANVGALMNAVAGVSGLSFAGLPGLVFSPFAILGAAVWNTLMADTDFIGRTYQKAVSINFAGHSQGAAIAELCWAKWQAVNPSLPAKLFKFGSPKVGNYAWVNGRRVDNFRTSIINDGDPIRYMPWLCTSLFAFTGGGSGWQNSFYENDPFDVVYNWDKAQSDGTTVVQPHEFRVGSLLPPNGNWRYHQEDAYRKLLWRINGGWRRDSLNWYRFNALDFPFENSFNVNAVDNGESTIGDRRILTPAPPIVVVPSNMIPVTPQPYQPDTGNGEGGGGDDDVREATPSILVPAVAPPGTPTWSAMPMAVRNRTRAR